MAKQAVVKLDDYRDLIQCLRCDLSSEEVDSIREKIEKVSVYLEQKYIEKLNSYAAKESSCKFYFLGSYARGEASLYSDIDVLLRGEQEELERVKDNYFQESLPIRARSLDELPPFSVMEETSLISLMNIKVLSSFKTPIEFDEQVFMKDFLGRGKEAFLERKDSLIEFLYEENKKRRESYNSISNYLEPHLKLQPGGLRDLFQAQLIVENLDLWAGKGEEILYQIAVYRTQLLCIRQALHGQIKSDVLLASEQASLSEFFGFKSTQKFMTYLQKICDDSAFLCRWVFAVARKGREAEDKDISIRFKEIFEDPVKRRDIRYIKIIRDWVESREFKLNEFRESDSFLQLKKKISNKASSMASFLYESKILDALLPDFKRVRHLVQHDQYHRYTVGAHSFVAIRNVFRMRNRKINLSHFSQVLGELSEEDWDVLLYTALFHDLGKGYKKDHSIKGLEIVDKYIGQFSQSEFLKEEVKWMVKNHLLFSKVAFRTNLSGAGIFRRLESENLNDQRARNLSVFTLIDIMSSNPEALTDWKESLLFDLYSKVIQPDLRFGSQLEKDLRLKYPEVPTEIWESLDVDLLSLLSEDSLAKLFSYWEESEEGERFQLFQTEVEGQILLSFQKSSSEIGLLNSLLGYLVSSGFNILKVNANSSQIGVLDLFLVQDARPNSLLENLIRHYKFEPKSSEYKYPLSSQWRLMENGQWTVRSEGKDLKGILLGLTNEMYERNLDVDWVNIYKWGRQIEVVLALSHGEVPPDDWQQKTWDL